MKKFICLALLAAALPTSSFASIVTYDFLLIAVSGDLAGETSGGSFSYDSSVATPGLHFGSALLTDLDFTWNGIAYDETSANTGFLDFGASGDLEAFAFGTDCHFLGCSVRRGHEEWILRGIPDFLGDFEYTTRGSREIGTGLNVSAFSSITTVPEPAPLALMGCALIAFALVRRKLKV